MEAKSRFKVKLSNEAQEFLDGLPNKVREKIISNIRKSTFVLDPDLFKKLDDTDIWEFRTFYNKTKYRLLSIPNSAIFLYSTKFSFIPSVTSISCGCIGT